VRSSIVRRLLPAAAARSAEEERKTEPGPPSSPSRRSTRRFSRVTYVRDLPVLSLAACSRCALPLISVAIDGYLSSRMSLKRRVQTSGYVFPISFGIRIPPRIRSRDDDDTRWSRFPIARPNDQFSRPAKVSARSVYGPSAWERVRAFSSSIWKGETAVRGGFPALGDHGGPRGRVERVTQALSRLLRAVSAGGISADGDNLINISSLVCIATHKECLSDTRRNDTDLMRRV